MKTFVSQVLALATAASASIVRLNPAEHSLALRPRQNASCEHSATSRSCWGDFNTDTNYYEDYPDTGVTREYWLTVQEGDCAPDGVPRTCMTINGTVPGPTIIADWGDRLVVHVTNTLQDSGTAIHWHGLRQLNSAEHDGVPGVTQCPIAPNETMTYDFRVTQYGSTWYHSHYSLQYAEGLFGGMVLNGPATADYDEDLGMLFLNDWSHTEAFELWEEAKFAGPPTMETGLVNGTNTYEGAGAKYETVFEAGKKYRFRVVNSGTDSHFQFSIDGHNLTVIANDMVPIEPFVTDAISIGIGQRYDVIVEANQPAGDYWLRGQWVSACATNGNPDGITGIIRYDAASTADPTSESIVTTAQTCYDEPVANLVPRVALDVGPVREIALQELSFATGGPWFQWTLNGSSLELDWEAPTIVQMLTDNTSYPADYNVISIDRTPGATETEYVVLVVQDDTGFGITHPMHLHGHDFWILAQDTGLWSGDASNFNTVNPPRRDTASLPGNGYIAMAFALDNPGAWLVHCHIAWHASEGFALEFVEDQSVYTVGNASQTLIKDTCDSWAGFMGTETYELRPQDDSGI